MTPEEKKMKQYTNSVERRLNMPEDVKRRVMNDFISSISARREAGQSDAEIYAELGSAKQAAADLNEQMREFAYRKSPWRFAFAALAVCGGKDGVITGPFPPCGVCRQVMREFCDDDFIIYLVGAEGSIETVTLSDLLPHSFSAQTHMK